MLINKLLPIPTLFHHYCALRHGQSKANIAKIISSDPSISTIQHGLSTNGETQVKTAAQQFITTNTDTNIDKDSVDIDSVDTTSACSVVSYDFEKYQGVALYSSDFLRTKETSTIFLQQILQYNNNHLQNNTNNNSIHKLIPLAPFNQNGSPQLSTSLRERYFGNYNNQSDDNYHNVWKLDCIDPNHTDQNVESVNSVTKRVTTFILQVEEELNTLYNNNDNNNDDDSIDDEQMKKKKKPWLVILVAHGDVLQILQTAFQKMDGSQHRSLEHLETATLRRLHLASSS